MEIRDFLRFAIESLNNADIETPELEAGVILCHALKCNRAYLYSHDDRVLNQEEVELLNNMLNQRMDNVPLQYIIGETEFMGLPFIVSPDVLIPRHDTETLVEECIKKVSLLSKNTEKDIFMGYAESINIGMDQRKDLKNVKVLDMCTGSGCIAISIAHYCPESTVMACDVSKDALKIAALNCERNEVQNRVELHCGNLFDAIDGGQQFNLIVSNPPYIESDVIPELQIEVRNYEPCLALDGGRDGLDFYREIIAKAPAYLTDGGYILFEIGYNQGESVKELMNEFFCDINVLKDISTNDRAIVGRYLKNKY